MHGRVPCDFRTAIFDVVFAEFMHRSTVCTLAFLVGLNESLEVNTY